MEKQNPNRTILSAVDIDSGEIINAETLNNTTYAKYYRRRINNKDEKFICLHCEKELGIRPDNSNKDIPTYHFYHKNNYTECGLLKGKLSKIEREKLNKIYASKESKRHKELKQKIYNKLLKVELVEKGTVKVEQWIFENNKLERRPDVFCIYDGKKIAFEIQISELSHTYMLERYNFYKKQHIHLLWILDKFDFKNSKQFIKDITELNNYENIFRLNEISERLEFVCNYPEIYLDNIPEIKERIGERNVPFENLIFDENFQIYIYNYPLKLRKFNNKKEEILKEREQKRIKKEKERKLYEEQIIKESETNWQNKWLQLTKKYNKPEKVPPFISEHCYFYIKPNNNLTVFFPEKRIQERDIEEMERENSNILWVVNAADIFDRGDIRSVVKNLLKEHEDDFSEDERDELKTDFENKKQSLEYKIDNKRRDIERLEANKKEYSEILNDTTEIKKKLIQIITDTEYYFDHYELKTEVKKQFSEKFNRVKIKISQIKKAKLEIEDTLSVISNYKKGLDNFHNLKELPTTPDKEIVNKYFENFTIIEKSSYKSLFKEIITKDKLPFVFYKPNNYIYLYDYSKLIESSKLKQQELLFLETKSNSEISQIEDQIEIRIKEYFVSELKKIELEIEEEENNFIEIKTLLEFTTKQYYYRIEEYNKERKQIMIENKGLYYFNWKTDLLKWQYSKYPLFIDTGENHVFWIKEENILKKVNNSDFIRKLITIKKTKKKWL